MWSIPGGRSIDGELPEATCVREVREETGLAVRILAHAGTVVREGPAGVEFEIEDFICAVIDGELQAGDDAGEARWVTRVELDQLELATGLRDALESWNVLPD
jgi:ADP-ribose pyrophosphatase YjhB (NUDIX family)